MQLIHDCHLWSARSHFLALLATTTGDARRNATTKSGQYNGADLIALERLQRQHDTVSSLSYYSESLGQSYFSFDIVTIALRELGIAPEHLGWIFAVASLVGAAIGLVIHKLKELSLSTYMIIDIGILFSVYLAGYSGNVWLLVVAAVLSISFWRYRRIIYQDHLLASFQTGYKSTLLSVMNTTESLNMLWVPIVTTAVVGGLGVTKDLAYSVSLCSSLASSTTSSCDVRLFCVMKNH